MVNWVLPASELGTCHLIANHTAAHGVDPGNHSTHSGNHSDPSGGGGGHHRLLSSGGGGGGHGGGDDGTVYIYPWGMDSDQATIFTFFVFAWFSYYMWARQVYYTSIFNGNEDYTGKLLFLMVLYTFGGMSFSSGWQIRGDRPDHAYGDSLGARSFFGSYALTELVKVLQLSRAMYHNWHLRKLMAPRLVGSVVMFLMGVVVFNNPHSLDSQFKTDAAYAGFFATHIAVVLVGWCTGPLRRAYYDRIQPHPEHYAERFGLMVIIALGEAFVQIINGIKTAAEAQATDPLNTATYVPIRYLGALFGVVTIFSTWWLYFQEEGHELLEYRVSANMWQMAHFWLLVSIAAGSAGISAILTFTTQCTDALPQRLALGTTIPVAISGFCVQFLRLQKIRRLQRDSDMRHGRRRELEQQLHGSDGGSGGGDDDETGKAAAGAAAALEAGMAEQQQAAQEGERQQAASDERARAFNTRRNLGLHLFNLVWAILVAVLPLMAHWYGLTLLCALALNGIVGVVIDIVVSQAVHRSRRKAHKRDGRGRDNAAGSSQVEMHRRSGIGSLG